MKIFNEKHDVILLPHLTDCFAIGSIVSFVTQDRVYRVVGKFRSDLFGGSGLWVRELYFWEKIIQYFKANYH